MSGANDTLVEEVAIALDPMVFGEGSPGRVTSQTLDARRRRAAKKRARVVIALIGAKCAGIAAGWQSSLRPGSIDRLNGHQEAGRAIAAAILAATQPDLINGERND